MPELSEIKPYNLPPLVFTPINPATYQKTDVPQMPSDKRGLAQAAMWQSIAGSLGQIPQTALQSFKLAKQTALQKQKVDEATRLNDAKIEHYHTLDNPPNPWGDSSKIPTYGPGTNEPLYNTTPDAGASDQPSGDTASATPSDTSVPASIRNNNPGAMWPGPVATSAGSTRFEQLKDKQGNKIATFDDPVQGATAQFQLLSQSYAGKPLNQAIARWSGGNSSPEYAASVAKAIGVSPDAPLTRDLITNPKTAIPLAKAMARFEAGRDFPMTDDQWIKAHQAAFGAPSASAQPSAVVSANDAIARAVPPAEAMPNPPAVAPIPEPIPAATPGDALAAQPAFTPVLANQKPLAALPGTPAAAPAPVTTGSPLANIGASDILQNPAAASDFGQSDVTGDLVANTSPIANVGAPIGEIPTGKAVPFDNTPPVPPMGKAVPSEGPKGTANYIPPEKRNGYLRNGLNGNIELWENGTMQRYWNLAQQKVKGSPGTAVKPQTQMIFKSPDEIAAMGKNLGAQAMDIKAVPGGFVVGHFAPITEKPIHDSIINQALSYQISPYDENGKPLDGPTLIGKITAAKTASGELSKTQEAISNQISQRVNSGRNPAIATYYKIKPKYDSIVENINSKPIEQRTGVDDAFLLNAAAGIENVDRAPTQNDYREMLRAAGYRGDLQVAAERLFGLFNNDPKYYEQRGTRILSDAMVKQIQDNAERVIGPRRNLYLKALAPMRSRLESHNIPIEDVLPDYSDEEAAAKAFSAKNSSAQKFADGKTAPASIPTINSKEEYDALPSGTLYIDSNGVRAKKK